MREKEAAGDTGSEQGQQTSFFLIVIIQSQLAYFSVLVHLFNIIYLCYVWYLLCYFYIITLVLRFIFQSP